MESFVSLDESWLAAGTFELPASVVSGPNKLLSSLLLLSDRDWLFDAPVPSPRKSRSEVLFEMGAPEELKNEFLIVPNFQVNDRSLSEVGEVQNYCMQTM